jgi:hypothetical protein
MENFNNQPKKQAEQKPTKAPVFSFALFGELAIEFAVILAVPLIGAIYLGKWLEAKYDTKTYLIVLSLLALALSWYTVIKKIMGIKDRIYKK